MKLLVFSPFYPPHIGGLESHALEFNRHLAPLAKTIVVFTPHLPPSAPVRETTDNITTLRYPAFEPIHNYPLPKFWRLDFWQLWNEALRVEPTHLVSRTRFFFPSLMAWYVAKTRRLLWLHIEHGSDFVHFHSPVKSLLGRLYDRIFGRFILKQADRVVANSQASAHFVQTLSGRTDCEVIYRGVEVGAILHARPHDEIRKRFPDRVVVGYLGRLIEGKGVIHILEALAQLKNPRLACAIIGNGPEQAKLQAFVTEHQLEDSVIFLGHRPFPEAVGLMKSFDIFVNPSFSEGIPTSVIEAAFLRKAIIATAVGGTPEIITGKDDGFLIPPGSASIIAEKLAILVDDSALRHRLGEQAFLSVKDRFAWRRAMEKYLALFSRPLSKTKKKTRSFFH